MDATAHGGDLSGRCRIRIGDFTVAAGRGESQIRGPTKITVRPERVRLEPHGTAGENRLPGVVERWVYLGNAVQLIVRLATGDAIQALIQNTGEDIPYAQGTPVHVHLPADALRVLKDTGERYKPEKAEAAKASS
jgi:spermidine/putrescine transport system ATP-binding protein